MTNAHLLAIAALLPLLLVAAAGGATASSSSTPGVASTNAFDSRGPYPVGVRTVTLYDAARNRTMPAELYYPATAEYAGKDLDPSTQDTYQIDGDFTGGGTKVQAAVRNASALAGNFPAVIYSHGFAGHRREFTYFTTFMASHGFRVASVDHVGSNFVDIDGLLKAGTFDLKKIVPQTGKDRIGDVPFITGQLDAAFGLKPGTLRKVGITGLSLGGWTSAIAPALDARIVAASPHCPGGVDGPLGTDERNILGLLTRTDYKSPNVKLLTLIGDRDSWLPFYGQIPLFESLPASWKALGVLRKADHQHFTGDMEASHNWFRDFNFRLAKEDTTDPKSRPKWESIGNLVQNFTSLMQEPEAQTILRGYVTQFFKASLAGKAAGRTLDVERMKATAAARNLHIYFYGKQ